MTYHNNRKIKVAISHGDINGISYELLLKLFADERILELMTPIIYGSGKAAAYWRTSLEIDASPWHHILSPEEARDGMVNIIDCAGEDVKVEKGKPTEQAGLLAYEALQRAVADVKAHKADILVTAPINKSVMPRDLFPYAGHTQYLEAMCGSADSSLMVLCSGDCRIALATGHIPVSEVSRALTTDLIVHRVKALEEGLIRDFGIVKPRIAVLGLNPHAGDKGLIGREEQEVIIPAITALEAEGHIVLGPYPADGLWGSGGVDTFDGVLAMYHDQGLAPFKAMYMNEGVNVTLGLSIIRTSPDHGTGYDIAGKGIASPDSLRSAIYLGIDMLRSRNAHSCATRNPLRRVYHNRSREDEHIDLTAGDEY